MAHTTVQQPVEFEEVIGGSRFIAYVWPVSSLEEANAYLGSVREQHPDATHHCSAFRVGEEQRFSDDGEPGGTAGRPMLEVLLKRNLDRVATVVVRYYGGRKLGAGGLVRAYSGAVAKALDLAGEREVVDMVSVTVEAPFAFVDSVLRAVDELLERHPDSRRGEPEFTGSGLTLGFVLPAEQFAGAERELTEITRGAAKISEVRR